MSEILNRTVFCYIYRLDTILYGIMIALPILTELGKGDYMADKIVLLTEGKKIFQFSIKSPEDSMLGETDIMIDTGKEMYFDHVILGNYFRHYKKSEDNINSISWHGYFKQENEKTLHTPKVHLKRNKKYVDQIFHFGTMNQDEPIAFPVCSIYIPPELNTQHIGKTQKELQFNTYVDVPKVNNEIRYDFFVLPKDLPIKKFKKSPVYLFYEFSDLGIFNTPDEGHNALMDYEMHGLENVGRHDVLLRIVKDPKNLEIGRDDKKQIYEEVSKGYSIIINEPNDIYHRLVDRPIIRVSKDGKLLPPEYLKDVHEKAIDFTSTNESNIWDVFRNEEK